MRKYLLPESGTFYKANLHCHTTMSDGKKTPQEVKALYLKKGYSIVAYTDHDVFLLHNDLTDETFLALNGFEAEIMNAYGRHAKRDVKGCHLCFVALREDCCLHPFWHRTDHLPAEAENYRDQVKYDDTLEDYEWSYTPECISEMMESGRKEGFFVTLNHPTWSREDYSSYSKYHGLHAIEMFNGGALAGGFEEYNPRVYDDLLRCGKKIFAIGTDDNHNKKPDDSRYSDSGWAWTMIKAKELSYRAVANALEAGDFYSSEGPEIYDLYVEDDFVHITCSPADKIFLTRAVRSAKILLDETGEGLTEAVFPVDVSRGYFRITVQDKYGKRACTNAYFLEDYME